MTKNMKRRYQAIFDKVSKHLLTQNKKAMKGTSCVFRDDEGRKCAIGCLIPDEDYKKEFEDSVLTIRFNEAVLNVIDAREDEIDLLSSLQYIHDQADVEDWKEKLEFLALHHDLNQDVLSGDVHE